MHSINENRPGYKHTPLGWIPADWKIKSLGDDIESLEAGVSVNSTNELIDGNTPAILKTSAVYGGQFFPDEKKKIVSNDITKAKVNPTAYSIIVSRMNTPELVGECAYVDKTHKDLFLPDRLWQIRFKKESEIDSRWLNYILNAPRYKTEIKNAATGTSNSMKNISKQAFLNTTYICPPKKEQLKIAKVLSKWDEAIDETKKIILQLEHRNKSLLNEKMTPKINWKPFRISDLLREVRRPIKWDDDELYHLLSVRRRSAGAFYRESLLGKQILTKQLFSLEEGDFLISKMQIVHGASAIVPPALKHMKVSGSYIVINSKNDKILDIEFFNWLSKTKNFYKLTFISSYGVHIEKMTFDYDDFKKRTIMLPSSIHEQKRIVQILDRSREEVNLMEQKLATLQLQKKGLMQKLLTGEIRVKI